MPEDLTGSCGGATARPYSAVHAQLKQFDDSESGFNPDELDTVLELEFQGVKKQFTMLQVMFLIPCHYRCEFK
ncbi:vacuolar H+-ATPase A2 subunit isoform [Corchorus olitorius]|uniref:Vacuolar H+-ATPase A2 subunit isoform n=1 Tax=Corchorus olitorius TaxID=93759 RepID=A0A1R3HH27_9ROSI|nr:vacuolar H+-ATPase A2 subunit isoform [Corchorus olitorius]